LAEGDDQSALLKLDELILNMPYRDLAPTSSNDKIQARKTASGVNLTPNTAGGPQSAAARGKSLQEAYSEYLPDDRPYSGKGLQWEALQESADFAPAHDDFGLDEWTAKPIDTFGHRKKIQEMIENDDFEDAGEHLAESMDGRGHFDWKSMGSPLGSIGNTDFTSLRDTGKNGLNTQGFTVK
jgi:hypothetical protein